MMSNADSKGAGQLHPEPSSLDWGGAIDPDGDCRIERDPQENKLTIFVPGKSHLLSTEIGRMNAPRVLREVEGDFDANVRVAGINHPGAKASTTAYAPFHGAGILIWQDGANYVRLEIAADLRHGTPRPYINFEYRKDGALAASSGMKNGDGSNRLKVERRGNEISAAFSPDGAHWTSFPPLLARLSGRLRVGVVAISSSTKPLVVELTGFEVAPKPPHAENAAGGAAGTRSTKGDDRQVPH
jgi:hypothetical protein